MVSFRLPLLKGRQNPVGASLDERAVIVRDRVHLQHVPGQQRDHSEFERLRPSALSRERRIQSRWRRDPFSLNEGRRGTRACFRMLIAWPGLESGRMKRKGHTKLMSMSCRPLLRACSLVAINH
jgi:hypothetical protein